MWLNLMALHSSGKDRDDAVTARDFVEDYMTPAQIADAQTLAREWQAKHGKI